MSQKVVRAVDDIVFESVDPVFTIFAGSLFIVEGVNDKGVILETYDGERYCIDFKTFEAGFEIAASGAE